MEGLSNLASMHRSLLSKGRFLHSQLFLNCPVSTTDFSENSIQIKKKKTIEPFLHFGSTVLLPKPSMFNKKETCISIPTGALIWAEAHSLVFARKDPSILLVSGEPLQGSRMV
jgi:hypothetical protein